MPQLYIYDEPQYSDADLNSRIDALNRKASEASWLESFWTNFVEEYVRAGGTFEHMTSELDKKYPDKHKDFSFLSVEHGKINTLETLKRMRDEFNWELFPKDIKQYPPMSEEEWKNSEHYREELEYEEGMTEGWAKYLAEKKDAELKRREILSQGKLGTIGGLTSGFLGQAADPTNAALSLIPIIGQARLAVWGEKMLGTFGRRAVAGAYSAFLTALPAEYITYTEAQRQQAEYSLKDSVQNIIFAPMIGAGFHLAFGKIGDIYDKRIGRAGKEIEMQKALDDMKVETAKNIDTVERALGIDETSIETKDIKFKTAVVQTAKGESVKVAHFDRADRLDRGITDIEEAIRLSDEAAKEAQGTKGVGAKIREIDSGMAAEDENIDKIFERVRKTEKGIDELYKSINEPINLKEDWDKMMSESDKKRISGRLKEIDTQLLKERKALGAADKNIKNYERTHGTLEEVLEDPRKSQIIKKRISDKYSNREEIKNKIEALEKESKDLENQFLREEIKKGLEKEYEAKRGIIDAQKVGIRSAADKIGTDEKTLMATFLDQTEDIPESVDDLTFDQAYRILKGSENLMKEERERIVQDAIKDSAEPKGKRTEGPEADAEMKQRAETAEKQELGEDIQEQIRSLTKEAGPEIERELKDNLQDSYVLLEKKNAFDDITRKLIECFRR